MRGVGVRKAMVRGGFEKGEKNPENSHEIPIT
jgi:hypothetical protein